MQLGNLDNEVIFKKAFSNEFIFKAFVKDVLGIEFEVGTIETEKKFEPKIGYIDFELDIYAESVDKRICVEIQRVEYDNHFDRFLHYFLMLIAQQQKTAREYRIEQTVYMIVVLTEKYTINEKNALPIKDEVLLLNFNPQTIDGKIRDLYGHQFVCLNPNYPAEKTPQAIRDWLDLIYQSIHNPQRPVLNMANAGIKKAIELISFENLTPEERAESKKKEAGKISIAKAEQQGEARGKAEGKAEGIEIGKAEAEVQAELEKEQMILEMAKIGLPMNQIANIAQKTAAEVQQILEKYKK